MARKARIELPKSLLAHSTADNKMTSETTYNSVVAGSYSYDGDGRRVKRIVNAVETWQAYGIGGELIAEYAANGAPSSPQKEYGYRNGELLITATITSGWGAPPSYTGPNPLSTGDQIKLENLAELRSAVNQLRQHAGLAPYNFTIDPNPQQHVTTVKADHIRQLRTALEEARTALGLSIGGYEHPTLTENFSLIYAVDFQELRGQILSAWQSGGGVDIRWLVADQLGTPRMIFDQTGSLANVSRHDYLPFGEELFAGTGGRTTAHGYTASDNVRQKFTSKERDNETGLDYFLARYYSSPQGRFTSPDEFSGGPDELYDFADHASENPTFYAELDNPQSLNKYQYTYNNPVNMTDEDGHCPICPAIPVAVEVIGTAADLYSTYKTWRDPSASRTEIVVVTALTVSGALIPVASGGGALGKVIFKKAVRREAAQQAVTKANDATDAAKGPAEAYNRRKHYGNTPTKADRKAVGGESADHDPPLVQRYYEGDTRTGEKPGYKQTPQERKASAKDRNRMNPATKRQQHQQGGRMSGYSKQKKKEYDLK